MVLSTEFKHESFVLDTRTGILSRKPGHAPPLSAEQKTAESRGVLETLATYVQARMTALGLVEHWIPDADDGARCNIFVSDLAASTKLLVILQNQVGSKPGLWSRSLCLLKGLESGSMLNAIEEALSEGYAVAVLNPNTNSVLVERNTKRVPIANSFSPEAHVLWVWDTFVASSNISSVYLLTHGNGSSLAVDIVIICANSDFWLQFIQLRFKGRWFVVR